MFTELHLASEERMALSHGPGSELYESMVDELVAETKSARHWEKRISAIELGHLGPGAARAIPELETLLQDKEQGVRTEAAIALARIGSHSPEAVKALIEAMKHSSDHEKHLAAQSLGIIGTDAKDAVPELIEQLQEGHVDVRVAAYAALEKIGTQEALNALNSFRKTDWQPGS